MTLVNKKILIAGASSDLAAPLNAALLAAGAILGLHYFKNDKSLSAYSESPKLKKMAKDLNDGAACRALIQDFIKWAGGIDYLILLPGNIRRSVNWQELDDEDWNYDLNINLKIPFFLAQAAIPLMKDKGGRIIFMSTASASRGGGPNTLAYGVSKAGVECVTKRLAADCAPYKILVNAVAPGFFVTKFHTDRMQRSPEQLKKRIEMIPLKRSGTADEFAGTILFLLSEPASYITGQVIELSGGDWI